MPNNYNIAYKDTQGYLHGTATIIARDDIANKSETGNNTIVGQTYNSKIFGGEYNTCSKSGQVIFGGKNFDASNYPGNSYFFPNDKGELMMWIDGSTNVVHVKAMSFETSAILPQPNVYQFDWTLTLPIVLAYVGIRTWAWVRKTYENGCKWRDKK